MIALIDKVRLNPDGAARAAYHPGGFVWEYDEVKDRARWFKWDATGLEDLPGFWSSEVLRGVWRSSEVGVREVPTSVYAGWRHFEQCRCRECRVAGSVRGAPREEASRG